MGECDETIHSFFYFNDTQTILKFSKPFRAWAYYLDKKINLLTQKILPCDPQELREHLTSLALFNPTPRTRPRVIHLNYNFERILSGDHIAS